jgi:hemerythrin-like domain-containing protein
MSNIKSFFRNAAADFDHPLEMLAACHDRIEERCDLLQRLIGHLRERGADSEARQAATNVIRYFDTAGENHHRDEEDDLFPRLAACDPEAAEPLVARLLGEHREMRAAWASLRATLSRVATGESVLLEGGEVDRFSALYRGHIDLEERELLPLAERSLGPDALAATGEAMARRRGVKP